MSKRNKIIHYVCHLLSEEVTLCGRVVLSRVKTLELDQLPCTLVGISRETAEIVSNTSFLNLKKTAELTIQILIEGEENSEDVLHQIISEVEHILFTDDSMGDLVSRIMPHQMEIETYFEGERPLGIATLSCDVTYFEEFRRGEDVTDFERLSVDVKGRMNDNPI